MSLTPRPHQALPDLNQIRLLAAGADSIGEARVQKLQMTEQDLKNILRGVEAALEVFENNEGHLRAVDISLKSMLCVVKTQIAAELADEGSVTDNQSNDQPTLKFSASNQAG